MKFLVIGFAEALLALDVSGTLVFTLIFFALGLLRLAILYIY
jgi:hypothetical protein